MPSLRYLAAASVLTICTSPLHAQRLAAPFAPFRAELPKAGVPMVSPAVALFPVASKARDHRWEGLIIGAALLGATGGLVGHSLCSDSDTAGSGNCVGSTIGGGLVGAGIGAVLGVFIGSAIPKGRPPSGARPE